MIIVAETDNFETIYFYKLKEEPYGCFSNFSPHSFELDDVIWPTSEHYYQAQKFIGTPDAQEIRQAPSAKKAAEMGRESSRLLRADWEEVKDETMRRAVLKKFETHADIREILLATENKQIVEDSPTDYYWGIGADRSGKNKLGQILMEVREHLRKQAK